MGGGNLSRLLGLYETLILLVVVGQCLGRKVAGGTRPPSFCLGPPEWYKSSFKSDWFQIGNKSSTHRTLVLAVTLVFYPDNCCFFKSFFDAGVHQSKDVQGVACNPAGALETLHRHEYPPEANGEECGRKVVVASGSGRYHQQNTYEGKIHDSKGNFVTSNFSLIDDLLPNSGGNPL